VEGPAELVPDSVTSMEIPNSSKGKARIWPLVVVGLGFAVSLIESIAIYFENFSVIVDYSLYIKSMTIALFAPLPYLFGVAFMYFYKKEGNSEIIKLSTLGGITLVVCIVATFPLYYSYMSMLFAHNGSGFPYPDSMFNDYNNYMNLIRLLQSVGIVASLIGAYYAFTKRSFKGALLAGGFSVFLVGNSLVPLAMIPIALGHHDFPEIGKKPK
jgi:DMSO reductase anchor subunit